MFIAYLTLLSALSISGVAIFYSVIGLATIFPGAFWPVVIMGSVLEIGKLVTASWLYRHWKQTRWLLKSYLTIAVIILSLITSMGIFGFLSKAHLEQNLAENTVTQRIEVINNKILSQENYINRQLLVIERAEKNLAVVVNNNDDAIQIEKENLKSVEDKFKTLLAVETNTIKNLNDRIISLDSDVTAILTQDNKAFFNEEKAAADLKASQKEERATINRQITDAQNRINILKDDYASDTAVIQKRIEKLRAGDVDDKSGVYVKIELAEENILKAQNNIDDLVVEREPLEAKMIKLEAEVGPVKYIAALVVDWGVTTEVDTSEAVRWVILIIIFVFDPLAVLLLVAANQSLLRRFPVKPLPPEEVLDLEKPDDEDVTLKWNEAMNKNQKMKMEQATEQLKDWQEKLQAFKTIVPQPEQKDIEIIQKKTEKEDIDVVYRDPAEVKKEIKQEQEAEKKAQQIEEFKKREQAELEALEEVARKAREEDEKTHSEEMQEELEPIPEDRVIPNLTEVIEPEKAVKEVTTGVLGVAYKKGKSNKLPNERPEELLNIFHNEHGNFEDISGEELKKERDQSNKAQFLADVSLTKEEAEKHPAITESRMAFFQDIIDDIQRGTTTFENVPEDIRKTVAQIMDDDLPNPEIIKKEVEEERPMTDAELDELLEGWEQDKKPTGKTKMVIKDGKRIFVPVKESEYKQNEEQTDETLWHKTKELDLPEPEKNEVILPDIKNTVDEVPEIAEKIDVKQTILPDKFTKYRKRLTNDEDYRSRIEDRISNLITKIENKEIDIKDLTEQDQKVIMEILNQNE